MSNYTSLGVLMKMIDALLVLEMATYLVEKRYGGELLNCQLYTNGTGVYLVTDFNLQMFIIWKMY
jgi:hypothetical protein